MSSSGLRTVPVASAETLARELLAAAGAPDDIAAEVARHLVRSNRSGHDSHGVVRIPQYLERIERTELVADARPVILRERDTTALIDARRGFGHVAVAFATDWVIERACRFGTGAAAVRHCTHTGRLGEFTERIADAGMAGVLTVGAAGPGVGGMQLLGSTERFFGANPWSFSVPAAGALERVVFDGSASAIAEGKVRVALREGRLLPPDSIVDRQGKPSTNPQDFYDGGALMPIGGAVAAHKGYGLAMFSALFGGLAMIGDDDPTLIGASVQPGFEDASGQIAGVFVAAIDVGHFGDLADLRRMVGTLLDQVKVRSRGTVLAPGEAESRARAAAATSIRLDASLCSELEELALRYGVALPADWPAV